MALLVRHVLARLIYKNRGLLIRLVLIASGLFVFFYLMFGHRQNISPISSIAVLPAKYQKLFHKLNPVIENWGQSGEPVNLNEEQNEISEKLFSSAAFNVYISDRLSPNRTLPDPRPYECADLKYKLDQLGQASIVIIFTNEIWSALIRTIWSVVNRSPAQLLKEIILVDDFSDKPELKEPLDTYVKFYFRGLVKVIRLKQREGLIRARLVGAREATGDVLIFLDSHIETTNGWLEPLMKPIAEDHRNVVCPVIDVISDKDLQYQSGNRYFFQIGGFIWSGHFVWIDLDEDRLKAHPTEMVKTPTMAGGLFAINRQYFFDIGSYDEKMEIWGGENLEMSFRIWQCGGKLYIAPCSHVGHIFRDYHPYSFLGKDAHGLNTLRTVLVWMDEYSRYFFLHRQDLVNRTSQVDVSERLQLRKRLQCKSFGWYLENVYTEKKYIYDQNVIAYGRVRNPISNLCIDNLNRAEDAKHKAGVYECLDMNLNQWTNQMFSLMTSGEIRREEGCLTVDPYANHQVLLTKCILLDKVPRASRDQMNNKKHLQTWSHVRGGQIINEHLNLCLSTEGLQRSDDLRAVECNQDDLYQIWWFQKYADVPL